LELPLGGQPRIELAVRMPARQVVEEIERDTDILGCRAEMRVKLGDVPRLGNDKFLLLRALGVRRPQERLRCRAGHAECCPALEQFAPSDVHRMHLPRWIRVRLMVATALYGDGYSAVASACQGCRDARSLRRNSSSLVVRKLRLLEDKINPEGIGIRVAFNVAREANP